MTTPILSGSRIQSKPASVHESTPRRLPGAYCPGCGQPVEKRQLKMAVAERLLRNTQISSKRRVQAMNEVFPEDAPPAGGPQKKKGRIR